MFTLQPALLSPGDRIAVVSPASEVNPDYIDGAVRFLESEGFRPFVAPHAKGPAAGSYAAPDSGRLADLTDAWSDPSVRAILCARGGYGCCRLIDRIPLRLIADNPKWLIGFSDISILHALSLKAGVMSLHAPMARHLTLLPADHYCTRAMMRILTDGLPVEYIAPAHPLNRTGQAEGMLAGGNLAVINGLAATPFDPLDSDKPLILFIEDISEAIYAVERMLIRLRLAGRLDSIKGLVVGHFTEYRPDRNHPDMETMISRMLGDVPFPVAFGFPAGHTDDNLPLPLGAAATLTVTGEETSLVLS
ncbi:MAG: LD-carboxypeptidase [Muribaculaceae bacterium]|nr:LD-carboxypeptidase [Muribaculaceae bacterium]